ncbi:nitrogen fixation protein FixH [uncultured Piscinibacter sp.]|uniref:nitrogen fixation protein FixH n=1 Tax=uncultured Piscinibacter sp. TaxID=1131835 RepID=UPI0026188280|nr:nitrogen fixation protein FixH [uncultured Piscinibacter sp.]
MQNPNDKPIPWWRVPTVWMVVGGPLSVVVASIATAVIAWNHIDPVIATTTQGEIRPGDDVAPKVSPKDTLAPAMQGRNHAATPRP